MTKPPVDRSPGSDAKNILCVDLDRTLVRTDTLLELFALAFRHPLILIRIPVWLFQGRAVLKHELATRLALDVDTLPYNDEVLNLITSERAKGTYIVLATAASQPISEKIARHLGLFDAVLSSSPACNLQGDEKANLLVAKYGEHGFTYAGDSWRDIEVWRHSSAAIAVGVGSRLRSRIEGITELRTVIHVDRISVRTLIKLARVYQWVKNLLVFTPMFTSGAVTDLNLIATNVRIFAAMSFVASGIYIFNDILDVADDRNHPTKRNRPIANGCISISSAVVASGLFLVAGAILSWNSGAALIVAIYAVTSFAYSSGLKLFPLVDVYLLAALYTLRILAGGAATGIGVSLWLLAFSGFLFLALAIIKRIAEVQKIRAMRLTKSVRGYTLSDEPILIAIGIASTFASGVVLALYLKSPDVNAVYRSPGILLALVPLIIFWQCRFWLAVTRGFMHDDPIVYASRDWVSYCVFSLVLTIVLLAHSQVPAFLPL